ncbi:MAG: hypothetical protein WHV67_02380, partial [Thermoanaerobaculia bacterium]
MEIKNLIKRYYILLLAIIISIFQIYYFSNFIVDDAYITYRYSKNFVEGKGLVFNEGERVEGITNFLYSILISFG